MAQLVLYGTLGCHLCEQAEALVETLSVEQWDVQAVDIAEDEALLERYGVRIPVLRCVASGRELGWPFDAVSLREWLARLP